MLDHRIDNVGLAAVGDFAAQKIPHAGEMFGRGPARVDGRAAGRHLVDDGDIEIAEERERERARDGRGGHHQDVGRVAPLSMRRLRCRTPKRCCSSTMTRPELGEGYGIFEQRVRADDELRLAGGDAFDARRVFRRVSGR